MSESDTILATDFWDRNGEAQQLEAFPESFQHWQLGEPLVDDVQQAVLQKLERLLRKEVVRTELRAVERNLVLEVEYEDGQEDILRMPKAAAFGSNGEITQDLALFTREVGLLQWLKANVASLPVPRVLAVLRHSDSEPYTFALIEKMPGDCLMNVFGELPFDIKESIVRNTASFMLELNNLVVPQRIGTTLIRDDIVDLVPLVSLALGLRPSCVFDTLEEYMHSLVQAKRDSDRISSDDPSRARANEVLDRLVTKLPSIFQRLSPSIYRRCTLSHDDLNETNVLVGSDGRIAVVDWEFHSVRPVVLAAQYPCGCGAMALATHASVSERSGGLPVQRMRRDRAIYAEVMKSQNEDYWRALVDGELLRQIYEWLTDPHVDPGCAAMEEWMDETFGSHSVVEVEG
ncbi:hypothetical protein LXA43DRAFT_382885 [Ganoderma leucocontextum]|nr:hypothetical protein LXA43DRAFT_382885 [Ganoderma leucocontextum]